MPLGEGKAKKEITNSWNKIRQLENAGKCLYKTKCKSEE
jgi:hypothetical protein